MISTFINDSRRGPLGGWYAGDGGSDRVRQGKEKRVAVREDGGPREGGGDGGGLHVSYNPLSSPLVGFASASVLYVDDSAEQTVMSYV